MFNKINNDSFKEFLNELEIDQSSALHKKFIEFYSETDISLFMENLQGQIKFSELHPPIDDFFHGQQDASGASIFENEWSIEDHKMIILGEDFIGNRVAYGIESGCVFYWNDYENVAPVLVYSSFDEFIQNLQIVER